MNLDLGSLFAQAAAILRQRFWPMLGLWAVFIAILFAMLIAYFILLGASMVGLTAVMGGDSIGQDTGALEGLGVGFFVSFILFYLAVFVVIFAQQGAMCAKATPIEDVPFGEAMVRGFKAGLTMTALMIPLLIVQTLVGLLGMVLAGLASAASPVFGVILVILMVPLAVYLACRLAVLVPVIAVEGLVNPIKAVRRAWSITSGRALAILVVLLLGGAIGLVVFGLPVMAVSSLGDPGSIMVALTPLLLFPLMIAYFIFFIALTACLHAQISDYGAQNAAEIFE